MYKKLSNKEWQEQIDEYYNNRSSVTINKFCAENNFSKQQFHYHKKKRINSDVATNTVFQGVSITSKESFTKISNDPITIEIGSSLITIPASETAIISLIIKELVSRC